jgi:hypothetical protein
MLCDVGKALMQELEESIQDIHSTTSPLTDTSISESHRRELFRRAQKHRKAISEAFLDHKQGCVRCRTSESEIRRRAKGREDHPNTEGPNK